MILNPLIAICASIPNREEIVIVVEEEDVQVITLPPPMPEVYVKHEEYKRPKKSKKGKFKRDWE